MKWQPIESAPKDGTAILAISEDDLSVPPVVVYWSEEEFEERPLKGWAACCPNTPRIFPIPFPTHWMALEPFHRAEA